MTELFSIRAMALSTVPLWSLAPMDRHLPSGAILPFRSSGRAKSGTALLIRRPDLAALGLARRNFRGGAFAQSKCSLPIPRGFSALGTHLAAGTNMLRLVTKYSATVGAPDQLNEVMANAFRAAEGGRPGAHIMAARKPHSPLAAPTFAGLGQSLIQPSPLPEHMIGLDPEFYLQKIFSGRNKTPGAIART